jgi:hypothetical protein
MDTYNFTANDLFAYNCCVMIPRFQRRYSWNIGRAHNLIRDIAEVATREIREADGKREPHWIGAVIYRELPKSEKCLRGRENAQHRCREIVDGQQRLTTIRLWTLALLHHAEAASQSLSYELTDLWLQKPNDEQLAAIIRRDNVFDNEDNISIVYSYFRFLLWLGESALLEPEDFKPLDKRYRGHSIEERWERHIQEKRKDDPRLAKSGNVDCASLLEATLGDLSLLGIELKNEEPAKVFEALNGHREELGQFDHLRNFVFSEIRRDRENLFSSAWEPAEKMLETVPTKKGLGTERLKSLFLYDYLISLGEGQFGRFNSSESFASFLRLYRSSRFNRFGTIQDWVQQDLGREVRIWRAQYSHHFEKISYRGQELVLSASAKRSMQRIKVVSDGPPAPLVMLMLRCALLVPGDARHISSSEVEKLLRKLEGFMFKTLLSEGSLTNLRAEITRSMHRLNQRVDSCRPGDASGIISDYIESLMTIELSKGVNTRDPRFLWKTLRQNIEAWHLRHPAKGVYDTLKPAPTLALLDVIDEELGSSRASGFLRRPNDEAEEPYWVEHIFPQAEKLWLRDLKSWNVETVEMSKRLDSLGNLTALERGINKNIKNKPFEQKKAQIEEEKTVPTKLNSWMESPKWTPDEIDKRTYELLLILEHRWPD